MIKRSKGTKFPVTANTLNTRSKEPALVWYIDDEKFNILSNELTLLSHFDRMNVKYVKTEYSAIFRLVHRTHSLIYTHKFANLLPAYLKNAFRVSVVYMFYLRPNHTSPPHRLYPVSLTQRLPGVALRLCSRDMMRCHHGS